MRRAFGLVVAALTLAACGGSGTIHVKDPGPVPNLTTTTAEDFSGVGLKGVSNRTTTSIPMGPGQATLSGTVTGPDGPVDAATVHVERLVGNAAAATDIATLADGTWSLPSILGGRYRVRAWKTPELALTKPEIFYLQGGETKALALRVDRHTGIAMAASIAPNPPLIDESSNLYVLVADQRVDEGGIVRSVAVPNTEVDLSGSGYQLETTNPASTDTNGVAQWRVRCTSTAGSLTATVSTGSFPLTLPACVDSGAVPPSTSSTTSARRTTSSTRR